MVPSKRVIEILRLDKVIRWIRRIIGEKLVRNNPNLPHYLTIAGAFVVFAVALNLFVELTDELHDNELGPHDERIGHLIRSRQTPWLTTFFSGVTYLGDRPAYIAITVILAVIFFLRSGNWRMIIQMVTVLLLSSLSNIILKRAIDRERPALEHLVQVNTLSYPSGHSMSAMAFYGFLIYICFHVGMRRWQRIICVSLCLVLIVSIGLSRVYLGVHYPSDVAAGFIGGLIWVAFCIVIFNVIRLTRKRRSRQ